MKLTVDTAAANADYYYSYDRHHNQHYHYHQQQQHYQPADEYYYGGYGRNCSYYNYWYGGEYASPPQERYQQHQYQQQQVPPTPSPAPYDPQEAYWQYYSPSTPPPPPPPSSEEEYEREQPLPALVSPLKVSRKTRKTVRFAAVLEEHQPHPTSSCAKNTSSPSSSYYPNMSGASSSFANEDDHDEYATLRKRELWFQRDEIAYNRQKMNKLLYLAMSPHANNDTAKGSGNDDSTLGLDRYRLERIRHKKRIIKYLLKKFAQGTPASAVGAIAEKAGQWAREKALEEGSRVFWSVYGDSVVGREQEGRQTTKRSFSSRRSTPTTSTRSEHGRRVVSPPPNKALLIPTLSDQDENDGNFHNNRYYPRQLCRRYDNNTNNIVGSKRSSDVESYSHDHKRRRCDVALPTF